MCQPLPIELAQYLRQNLPERFAPQAVIINRGTKTQYVDPLPLDFMPHLHSPFLAKQLDFCVSAGQSTEQLQIEIQSDHHEASRESILQVYLAVRYSVQPNFDDLTIQDQFFVCSWMEHAGIDTASTLCIQQILKSLPDENAFDRLSFLLDLCTEYQHFLLWLPLEQVLQSFLDACTFNTHEEVIHMMSLLLQLYHPTTDMRSDAIIDLVCTVVTKAFADLDLETIRDCSTFVQLVKQNFEQPRQQFKKWFEQQWMPTNKSYLACLLLEDYLVANECTQASFVPRYRPNQNLGSVTLFFKPLSFGHIYCTTDKQELSQVKHEFIFKSLRRALEYHGLGDWWFATNIKCKVPVPSYYIHSTIEHVNQKQDWKRFYRRYATNSTDSLLVPNCIGHWHVDGRPANTVVQCSLTSSVPLLYPYPINEQGQYDHSVRLPVDQVLDIKMSIYFLEQKQDRLFAIKRFLMYHLALPEMTNMSDQAALNTFFFGSPFPKAE